MGMDKIIVYLVLLCFCIMSCDRGNIIPEDTDQNTEINTNEPETDEDVPSEDSSDEDNNNENEVGYEEGEGNGDGNGDEEEIGDVVGGGAEYYHSNSYIASFYTPISIKLLKYSNLGYPKEYEGVLMVIMDKYEEYSIRHQNENQDKYTKYLELCEYYGDTGYDTTYVYACVPQLFPPTFLAEEVSKIDLTCSEEYNGIPAGESLSSQFNFYTFSIYPFIKNGYEEKYDYSSIPAGNIVYDYVSDLSMFFNLDHYFGTPIVSSLDEVCYDDLKIMGGHAQVTYSIIFLLEMKSIPANPQGEIELTIELNNGEIFSARELVVELI